MGDGGEARRRGGLLAKEISPRETVDDDDGAAVFAS